VHRAAVACARAAVVLNQNVSKSSCRNHKLADNTTQPPSVSFNTLVRPFAYLITCWSRFSFCDILVMPAVGALLFSASLRSAASLKAVLDLVDKDYSQDAGTRDEPCLACGRLDVAADAPSCSEAA